MTFVCPECKNAIDLSTVGDVNVGNIVECNTCGITLEIRAISNGTVSADVVEEGK